ncbi:MAG: rod shape-determining protein MreD [bacterium]|nr:rod shape-determining protein MreD [bacterium]MDE0288043.1 rod shape-determining protein MreD [bacterium]
MTVWRLVVSLTLVLVAVLVQTTIFRAVRPFDVSPDILLLMVIACGQWLKPEAAVLLGFVGGLMLDLFGTAPLGLHALAYTLAAYATVRVGDRFNYGLYFAVSAVGGITFVGIATVALIGTLFGEGTLASPGIVRTLVLVPAYNTVLALAVLPMTTWLYGTRLAPRYSRPGTPI